MHKKKTNSYEFQESRGSEVILSHRNLFDRACDTLDADVPKNNQYNIEHLNIQIDQYFSSLNREREIFGIFDRSENIQNTWMGIWAVRFFSQAAKWPVVIRHVTNYYYYYYLLLLSVAIYIVGWIISMYLVLVWPMPRNGAFMG